MNFRSYDALRVFNVVAHHLSISSAANELNLSKGAVSYQIKRLESDLGFEVFTRHPNGISLTEKGKRLWPVLQTAFSHLDKEIRLLREESNEHITIGLSTYFAARWLSPRLMNFIVAHPKISLRLQPMLDLSDLRTSPIDMAIRWGKGAWSDWYTEQLFRCPAKATAGKTVAGSILNLGLEQGLAEQTLLHDCDGSRAWYDWHQAAGLSYREKQDSLVIPDPNVRVQAVIDGQGIALNDILVAAELSTQQLFQISSVELSDYGYYLSYRKEALDSPALSAFRDWIMAEVDSENTEWPFHMHEN